jgi:hypothetical protein
MKKSAILQAQARYNAALPIIAAALGMQYDPEFKDQIGSITQLNASMIVQGSFSEPLTTYATGWRDDGQGIQVELDFMAPSVQVGRRFEYKENINWEAYLSGTEEDLRASGGEFKTVELNSTKELAKTSNRGLQIVVDLDDVRDEPNWEQARVAQLMRRIKMNKLRRALAIYTAADTNTAKTWDTTAGKDPDQDVMSELVTAADAVGMKPNRVVYGDTAWSKRALAHRAQTSAGGFSSAGLTPADLAGILGVEGVLHSNSRYSSTKTAKAQVLGTLVLMLTAMQNADTEDPSNVKDFWSPTEQGVRYAVHSIPWGIKRHIIAVEHNESMKLTSNLGIRSLTIS